MDPLTEQQQQDYGRVARSMTNHTPSDEAIDKIENLRAQAKAFAYELIISVEPSRERSLALTHLEDAVMWGVKAIVLEQTGTVFVGTPGEAAL